MGATRGSSTRVRQIATIWVMVRPLGRLLLRFMAMQRPALLTLIGVIGYVGSQGALSASAYRAGETRDAAHPFNEMRLAQAAVTPVRARGEPAREPASSQATSGVRAAAAGDRADLDPGESGVRAAAAATEPTSAQTTSRSAAAAAMSPPRLRRHRAFVPPPRRSSRLHSRQHRASMPPPRRSSRPHRRRPRASMPPPRHASRPRWRRRHIRPWRTAQCRRRDSGCGQGKGP